MINTEPSNNNKKKIEKLTKIQLRQDERLYQKVLLGIAFCKTLSQSYNFPKIIRQIKIESNRIILIENLRNLQENLTSIEVRK